MKRFIYIFLTGLIWGLEASAQVPVEHVVLFPSWHHLYYDSKTANIYGEHSNIDIFFTEWEEWSALISKGLGSNEYNDIFKRHFCENNTKKKNDSKYISLPLSIEVVKYNCNINPDSIKVQDHYSLIQSLINSKRPESISIFTPKIESDKKVLYLSKEAQDVLTAFLDEPTMVFSPGAPPATKQEITEEDWAEVRKRRDMIGKYIPTIVAHWGDGWYFTSYPLINRIIVGNDGYYIDLSDANYNGELLFVPWDLEPIVLEEWIQ